MADKVKVKMLRPIGGYDEGDTRTLSKNDAERLEGRGAVTILGAVKDEDDKAEGEKADTGEKSEKALSNKAEDAAPANKAAVSGTVKKASK